MGTVQPELLQSAAPPEPRQLKPWQIVTFVLIALNVLVFVVMVLGGVALLDPTANSVLKWGADYGPLTLRGQWWRMFSSMFIHFGLFHILFNMIVLLSIGLFMESLSGRLSFLILYLVAGLGGSAASLALHPSTVSAGASGAIFGLYGGLLGFLLRYRDSIPPASLKSLLRGALIFVGYNLLYSLRPGVDMAAHGGGLCAGFVLGLFLLPPPKTENPPTSWRNFAAIALGLALVVVPLAALPKPDDYLAEYERMAAMEDKAIDLFNLSNKEWKANQLTEEQYAEVIEKQILPQWRAERLKIEGLKGLSSASAVQAKLLDGYMTKREEGWQLMVDGIRSNDDDKIKQGIQASNEADLLAQQISGAGK
jgi:rhomboid protease GluP